MNNVVLFPVMETEPTSVNNVVIFSVMETDYSIPSITVALWHLLTLYIVYISLPSVQLQTKMNETGEIWYPTLLVVKNLYTILISELLISILELRMDRYLFG